MNTENIKKFSNELLFGAFLLRFLPGFILYFGINSFTQIAIGGELLSLLFIGGISWTLGLLLEQICFVSYRKQLTSKETGFHFSNSIPLLFGFLGISIFTATLLYAVNALIEQELFRNREFEMNFVSDATWLGLILKLLVVAGFGLLFLLKGMNMMMKRK